jgi:uncharacterized protein YigA (DUF484 family)
MDDSHFNGRISWLTATLETQRNNIVSILLRLKGIGARAGTSMALHRKFMRFMEQVAHERNKELDIINEIEAIEKRHFELKRRRLLRRAAKEPPVSTADLPSEERKEEKPERMSLLTILGLFCLFSARPAKPKKQDPTVN